MSFSIGSSPMTTSQRKGAQEVHEGPPEESQPIRSGSNTYTTRMGSNKARMNQKKRVPAKGQEEKTRAKFHHDSTHWESTFHLQAARHQKLWKKYSISFPLIWHLHVMTEKIFHKYAIQTPHIRICLRRWCENIPLVFCSIYLHVENKASISSGTNHLFIFCFKVLILQYSIQFAYTNAKGNSFSTSIPFILVFIPAQGT